MEKENLNPNKMSKIVFLLLQVTSLSSLLPQKKEHAFLVSYTHIQFLITQLSRDAKKI